VENIHCVHLTPFFVVPTQVNLESSGYTSRIDRKSQYANMVVEMCGLKKCNVGTGSEMSDFEYQYKAGNVATLV
jgi:hypothetical protein